MSNYINYLDNENLRQEVQTAITELAAWVAVTLGPGGRTVILEQLDGKSPLLTKDGVTAARFFSGKSAVARVIADTAREVCERTAKNAGDGTTTAIVLAAALVKEGQKYLEKNKSTSPQKLTRELRSLFLNKIKPGILELSKPIKGLSHDEMLAAITHVAKVSANHDMEIASAVAKGVDLVGEDGMVIAEEGIGTETTVLPTDGFPINGGLHNLGEGASTAFVNGTAGDCRLTGAHVLLFDGDIHEAELLIPIMNQINDELDDHGNQIKAPLVIFAHNYSDTVLKVLAKNFRQQRFTCLPLVTPRNGQSHYKQQFLHDVAAYTGGVVFDPHGSNTLRSVIISQLGFLESIKAGRHETVLVTQPDVELIEERISVLKTQMEGSSEFDQDRIRYRIGQLTGGVATVFAGGVTAAESKERHARVVDAISAVRSAIELGVVPGGGATLLHLANSLSETGPESIFRSAFTVPFVQILRNAGATEIETISEYNSTDGQFLVFDALEMKYVDWWEAGILDPAKVTLTALENALSVAQLIMTIGGIAAISNSEEMAKMQAIQDGILKAMNQDM
jgi:chaperonin GroEL